MNLFRPLTLTLLLSMLVSTSCSKDAPPPSSSSAGALTANASLNLAARPFAKHQLNTPGFHYMNDFIRPDVRARMDEEPVGDADGGYDPATIEPVSPPDQAGPEPEARNEEPEQPQGSTDESPAGISLESAKFVWAKKSFGDAVKASPTSQGVIVLYADENYFDTERLMAYIQEGRDRIAEASGAPSERIQVVYGGYRSMPQVELWVIREGETMPEFKPDDRSKASQPEN